VKTHHKNPNIKLLFEFVYIVKNIEASAQGNETYGEILTGWALVPIWKPAKKQILQVDYNQMWRACIVKSGKPLTKDAVALHEHSQTTLKSISPFRYLLTAFRGVIIFRKRQVSFNVEAI
jgi:hypothetical protein